MPKTAFTQVPLTLTGVAGVPLFAAAEHPDVVNGNTFVHDPKVFLLVSNSHETDSAFFTAVTQKKVKEDAADLAVANPSPVEIGPGDAIALGPYSSGNFKKAADGNFEMTWTLDTGTIVAADVNVVLIKHP